MMSSPGEWVQEGILFPYPSRFNWKPCSGCYEVCLDSRGQLKSRFCGKKGR